VADAAGLAAPADPGEFGAPGGLFRRLRDAAGADWVGYTWHPFVRRLSDGTLPLAGFRHYLVQDYLFLIHFARAKALAVVKGESLEAMRSKAAAVLSILDETKLHLRYCAEWGLSEAEVTRVPETAETVSYTRWVMDRGLAGDILDLEIALAPCTVGYGEVARRILLDPARMAPNNPTSPGSTPTPTLPTRPWQPRPPRASTSSARATAAKPASAASAPTSRKPRGWSNASGSRG
jgi:thiaminase/transcriptional activator TenA